jgi:hypothetical protein
VRNPNTIEGGATGPTQVRPGPETCLAPHDFDRALRRMKVELAITDLRRRLLDSRLEARDVMEIADRVLALQKQL